MKLYTVGDKYGEGTPSFRGKKNVVGSKKSSVRF